MAIRNENNKQHATRFANMLRNSQARRAAGVTLGAPTRHWMRLDELVGVPFEIVQVDFQHESPQYGVQTRVDIELATGDTASFTANTGLTTQLQNMDADRFQDELYTIVQNGTFTSRGKTYPSYLIDFAEDETGQPNTPARNRARVASQKSQPQVTDYFEDDDENDDDEIGDDESDEIEVYTEAQYASASPTMRRLMDAMINDGNAVIEKNTRKASPKPVQASKTAKSDKTSSPTRKAAPAKSNKLPGKPVGSGVQVIGNGKFPRRPGRPPMGAAQYNSSNGKYYDADGNKLN